MTLILPFTAEVKGSGKGESASFTIKPAPDTLPGAYPVRVRTAEGISNLRLISVTDVPVIRSKEPNGRYLHGKLDLEQTQRVNWPCVIAGGRLIRDMAPSPDVAAGGEQHRHQGTATQASSGWPRRRTTRKTTGPAMRT